MRCCRLCRLQSQLSDLQASSATQLAALEQQLATARAQLEAAMAGAAGDMEAAAAAARAEHERLTAALKRVEGELADSKVQLGAAKVCGREGMGPADFFLVICHCRRAIHMRGKPVLT